MNLIKCIYIMTCYVRCRWFCYIGFINVILINNLYVWFINYCSISSLMYQLKVGYVPLFGNNVLFGV